MAEDKAPNPMWTTEKLHAVIEKIYSEYAPLCKTELGLMFSRDIATLMALQFQMSEAFGVARHTEDSAAISSRCCVTVWPSLNSAPPSSAAWLVT